MYCKNLVIKIDFSLHFLITVDNDGYSANPFKCRGDYCRVRMQSSGPLSIDTALAHHSEIFFTDVELRKLKHDGNYDLLMDFSDRDGPDLDMISMKSIR